MNITIVTLSCPWWHCDSHLEEKLSTEAEPMWTILSVKCHSLMPPW